MRSLFIIILLLVSWSINAQETWSLKQCIDYAFEHNLQIQQSKINGEIQQQQVITKKGQQLPNFNGFASHTYNFGQRIDPFTNQFANQRVQSNNFYLNSQITLFSGFQTKNGIKKSLIDYQIQEQNTEKIKNDIALAIAASYLQILFNEESIKITQQQIDITNQQLKRVEKQVKAGVIPQGNLLNLQSQLATDEMNKIISENQLILSTLGLKQLLQIDDVNNFRISIPETIMEENLLVASTPRQVYDAAIKIMPQVKTSQLQIQSAETGYIVAKGNRYPKLTLSGSLGTGYSGLSKNTIVTSIDLKDAGLTSTGDQVFLYNPILETSKKSFGDQAKDNFNQSIGFNLSIPISNRYGTKTAIETAKLNKEVATLQLQQTELQLRNDIEKAHTDAIAAMKKYIASLKAVDAQKLAFEYDKNRFEVGMLNAVDFNNTKKQLAKVKSQLLQAKYDYLFKIKILEFYQGKSLAF